MMFLSDIDDRNDKLRKSVRELVLRPIEGKETKDSRGIVDKRLFTGDVKLFAEQNPASGLWIFKYSAGSVPAALDQQFTSFSECLKFAKSYFERRGIKVEKVID